MWMCKKKWCYKSQYVMRCAIWCHLYNLKNVKPATLLKLTLLYGCFSRFLNCTNSTKSRNASHMNCYYINTYTFNTTYTHIRCIYFIVTSVVSTWLFDYRYFTLGKFSLLRKLLVLTETHLQIKVTNVAFVYR